MKTDTERDTAAGSSGRELSLEESFEQLDSLLERMEDRELPLGEAFSLYQQGLELMKNCNEKIDTVEKQILVLNGDGSFDEF
ncbi:MAG: exodeoxyribonuclease VII small subunit [Clostridiales bacterium]|nr:exodeoxyribonuclease VII small subunit [Clostridiales bacterium]